MNSPVGLNRGYPRAWVFYGGMVAGSRLDVVRVRALLRVGRVASGAGAWGGFRRGGWPGERTHECEVAAQGVQSATPAARAGSTRLRRQRGWTGFVVPLFMAISRPAWSVGWSSSGAGAALR